MSFISSFPLQNLNFFSLFRQTPFQRSARSAVFNQRETAFPALYTSALFYTFIFTDSLLSLSRQDARDTLPSVYTRLARGDSRRAFSAALFRANGSVFFSVRAEKIVRNRKSGGAPAAVRRSSSLQDEELMWVAAKFFALEQRDARKSAARRRLSRLAVEFEKGQLYYGGLTYNRKMSRCRVAAFSPLSGSTAPCLGGVHAFACSSHRSL